MLQPETKDPANRARQGVVGHNVWQVLAISLGGVAIFFALAYFYYFSAAPNPAGGG